MGRASRRKREKRSGNSQNNPAPVEQGSHWPGGVMTESEGAVAPERHGWGGRRTGSGRPRLYANDADRQAAYRARRRSGTSIPPENGEGKPPDGGAQTSRETRSPVTGRSLVVLALLAEVVVMAAVSIRNLDDTVRERLRVRAAAHGRSMEAEMRAILVEAVREPSDDEGLLEALAARFGELGGVDLDLPPRSAAPRAVDFIT